MRLTSLRMRNFRSCDDVTVEFDQYTCLVGPNGAGKSTVLMALNALFRHTSSVATNVTTFTEQDFCNRNTTLPIELIATFEDLSVDEIADFSAYVRQGRLVIAAKAVWDAESRSADVRQYGCRLVMEQFAPFFRSFEDAKAADLKKLYVSYMADHPELPKVNSKADMFDALRAYEEARPANCVLMESEDQFYGWSRGVGKLQRYVQWVYVPAVKDASTEQADSKNTAIGQLLQRTLRGRIRFDEKLAMLREETKRRYWEIVQTEQEALSEVSRALELRLHEWAHPNAKLAIRWNEEDVKSVVLNEPSAKVDVGEGDFSGDVSRSGHGMQRAFIVSVLQELASQAAEGAPTLILGFEEPELYQHPPQARHLARVLERLANAGTQVVVTTHSPYFVSSRGFEQVRMVRKMQGTQHSTVSAYDHARLANAIADATGEMPKAVAASMSAIEQILQPSTNEMFFCALPVLVEGTEDVAFLATQLQLSGEWDRFRKLGCHFVIADGKGKLSRLLAIANGLRLPAFVVFDADADLKKTDQIIQNKRENLCLLSLAGVGDPDPLPSATLWSTRCVMWRTRIAEDVMVEFGEQVWTEAEEAARTKYDFFSVRRKSPLLIAATLSELHACGKESTVLGRVCGAMLDYASGLDSQ